MCGIADISLRPPVSPHVLWAWKSFGFVRDLGWDGHTGGIGDHHFRRYFRDYQIQVLQRSDFSVCVRYKPHAGVDARAAVASVASRLKRLYGDRLPVEFAASRIDVNDNGKTRFVVSEVVR